MSLFGAISGAWALLLGIALLTLGNGLQTTLLGVRATMEGFSVLTTAVVMTAYFFGFVMGSIALPRMLSRVGHVRVFAALASLVSGAVLMHAVFVEPITWTAIRLVVGFSLAGLYIVAESWLNDVATNETRGQLLSVYMVIVLGSMAVGQFLLNSADPEGYELFILTSVLVSLSLVPITLSVGHAPPFEAPERVSIFTIYRASPLGAVASVASGLSASAMFGLGPVYAQSIGLEIEQVSYFMAAVLFGGVALQFPVGHLSDRFDRRVVITGAAFGAGTLALLAVGAQSRPELLWVVIFFFSGLALPIYSLSIAHTNDHLTRTQRIGASATLVLINGIGLSLGSIAAGILMSVMGPAGFLWFQMGVFMWVGIFALYRMTRRAAVPLEQQPNTVPMTRTSAVVMQAAIETMHEDLDREVAAPHRNY